MIDSVLNAFKIPDVRRKLLFTFAMLVIFRFLAHVPVPGVNAEALKRLFESNQPAQSIGKNSRPLQRD